MGRIAVERMQYTASQMHSEKVFQKSKLLRYMYVSVRRQDRGWKSFELT